MAYNCSSNYEFSNIDFSSMDFTSGPAQWNIPSYVDPTLAPLTAPPLSSASWDHEETWTEDDLRRPMLPPYDFTQQAEDYEDEDDQHSPPAFDFGTQAALDPSFTFGLPVYQDTSPARIMQQLPFPLLPSSADTSAFSTPVLTVAVLPDFPSNSSGSPETKIKLEDTAPSISARRAQKVKADRANYDEQPDGKWRCKKETCLAILSIQSLRKHTMRHSGVRFECEDCNKLFSRRDAVTRHSDVCPGRRRRRTRANSVSQTPKKGKKANKPSIPSPGPSPKKVKLEPIEEALSTLGPIRRNPRRSTRDQQPY